MRKGDGGVEGRKGNTRHILLWPAVNFQASVSTPSTRIDVYSTILNEVFSCMDENPHHALTIPGSELDTRLTKYTAPSRCIDDTNRPFRITVAKLCKPVKQRSHLEFRYCTSLQSYSFLHLIKEFTTLRECRNMITSKDVGTVIFLSGRSSTRSTHSWRHV